MTFKIRKVRNADKYALKIKDDNGTLILTQIFDSRDEAVNKARSEVHKEDNKPISTDTVADDIIEEY